MNIFRPVWTEKSKFSKEKKSILLRRKNEGSKKGEKKYKIQRWKMVEPRKKRAQKLGYSWTYVGTYIRFQTIETSYNR